MDITLRAPRGRMIAELTIVSGSTIVTEDIMMSVGGSWRIDPSFKQSITELLIDMGRADGDTDVDTVVWMASFLDAVDRSELIERLTSTQPA